MEAISKKPQIRMVAEKMGIELRQSTQVIDSYYKFVKYQIIHSEEAETGFLGFLVFSRLDKDLSTNERQTYAYQARVVSDEIGLPLPIVKGVLDTLRDIILTDVTSGRVGYNLHGLGNVWTEGGRLKTKHSGQGLPKNVRIRATNWSRHFVARDIGKTLV